MIKQHPTTIVRVGGYKVVYKPQNVKVVIDQKIYKATVDTRGYKIVYKPQPTNITREVENVTLKKGC